MATKRIEAQLTIKAVDQYSGMLRNMSNVTGRFADRVRSEMGQLQNLRGPLRLIEDFRRQQTVVRQSGQALAAAREKVRQLRTAITSTANPTAQMRRDFDRARAAATRLEQSHQRNRTALRRLQVQLQQAGVNTSNLASEQRRLASELDASSGAFNRQMDRMRRLQVMQERISAARERMDRTLATAANMNFVGQASMATGRRIMDAMSGPVRSAIEFESAMSDVRKVVDFETPQAFRQMADDILELSTRIPMAAGELAAIVAAGGQSGLQSDELLQFTELAAKVGVAFDISADRAGDAMASIKTAMGLTLDETSALFDAMNHLSNNTAARADQTLDFINRAGASGASFGFDNSETLAFGAAMIAAGAGSDTAATSFRNMGRALTRGASSTDRQVQAFEKLGLEAEAVARAMQEDAVGTTMDVLERMRELPDHLRASVMSDLFGDEARELTKLINNAELLGDTLGLLGNEAEFVGKSVNDEFAARAETTANNLQLMQNQMARLGVTIGEVVLPPLNDLLEVSQGYIDRLVAWSKENPKLTKGLVIAGVAVGALAVAGGALLTAAAGLVGTLAVLRFGLVGFAARAAFAGGNLLSLIGAFGRLRRLPRFALSSLIAPLRWGRRLIPAIRWASLAGALNWRLLITPLKWGLRFIPVIGWAVLAGELAWHLLIKPLGWDEYLPSIDWERVWGAFSWEGWLPEVDWGQFISAISWPEWVGQVDWDRVLSFAWGAFITPLSWGLFIPAIVWSEWFGFEWADILPSWDWGFIGELDLAGLIIWPDAPDWLKWLMGQEDEAVAVPSITETPGFGGLSADQQAAAQVVAGAAGRPLPTQAHLEELRAAAVATREEIARIEGEIANIGTGPMSMSMAMPFQHELAARKRDLEEIERELADAETQAASLTSALQVLDGTEAVPEINTDSIDRALEKVAALSRQLQALPNGSASAAGVPVQERAKGGPYRAGALLVGEQGPELRFESRGGFIATNRQLQGMQRTAANVRRASLSALSGGAVSMPSLSRGGAPVRAGGDVRVEIGAVSISVPEGVTNPAAIAELAADMLGERVAATMSASFSD